MTTGELEFKNYLGNWEPLTRIVVETEIRLKPEPPRPREWYICEHNAYETVWEAAKDFPWKKFHEIVHVREVLE